MRWASCLILGCVLVLPAAGDAKPSVKECLAKPRPREQAQCLEMTNKEVAIGHLHKIASGYFKKDPKLGIAVKTPFFRAARGAGRIAARTSDKRLFKLASSSDAGTRLFVAAALKDLMSILKSGGVRGVKPDKKRHDKLRPRVDRICGGMVKTDDQLLLIAATECLSQPKVALCERIEVCRDRAYCLLRAEETAALEPLLAVGLDLLAGGKGRREGRRCVRWIGHKAEGRLIDKLAEVHDGRQLSLEDAIYAAENAGRLAAMLEEDKLFVWARCPDNATQLFGVHALGHMLSLLRMGYGRGRDEDEKRFAELKPKVASVCLKKLKSKHAAIVDKAIGCVAATEDNVHAAALIEIVVKARTPRRKERAFYALRKLSRLSQQKKVLKKLAVVLNRPIPKRWSSSGVSLREGICGTLSLYLDGPDPALASAALEAVRQIGDKSSSARSRCQRLADKAAGK